MDSNSKPSLLTKLLRPDKKTKERPAEDDNRRYSAPVYGWWEVDPITVTSDNQLKPQKQKQKNKHSSQQNLSSPRKQTTTKTKSTVGKEKRKTTARSSWFCMSGNADTMDRSLMPVQNTNKNKNTSSKKKDTNNSPPVPVDILRPNGGKKIRDNKNRHSAPVPDWSAAKTTHNSESHETNQKEPSNKSLRDSPPGVRYRFDGTLEKPYVFPAGLTFGPEGRKLHLRRSSNSQVEDKPPIIPPRVSEKVVKVEVHKSSTEDIIMEYSYEESEPDPSDFDVRKAFYLKYDSSTQDSVDNTNSADSGIRQTSSFKNNVVSGQKQETRWKPKESSTNASQRSSKRQLRAERSKNRYSMPLKNEHFVYMGSCENLSMTNQVEHESRMAQSSVDISSKNPSSTNDGKRTDRRNRYSTPIKNTDFVYMGSFENINQLINLDNSSGFSLPNAEVGQRNNKPLSASTCLSVNNKSDIACKNSATQPADPQQDDFRSQSLTNLAVVSGSSLTNISNNINGSEVQQENRKQDAAKLSMTNKSSLTNISDKINSSEKATNSWVPHEESRHSSKSSEKHKDTLVRHEGNRQTSNNSEKHKNTRMPLEEGRQSFKSSEKHNDALVRHEVGRQSSTNLVVASGLSLSNVSNKPNGSEKGKQTSTGKEERRQSLTNLAVASGSSLQDINNINSSVDHKGSEYDDEEYDRFDDSLVSSGSTRSCPQENPFSRRAGRASYNPGNSRAFIPPPAIITTSLSSTTTMAPFSANLSRLSFMPGNKPFSIPPPPCYTPPKEDMDYSLAHQTETKCHRDSQTDLSIEVDSLNMEDRDSSLKLAEVKTIFAGISFKNRDGTVRAPKESPKHITKNYDLHLQGRKTTSVTSFFNPTPKSATIETSESTEFSDEVFRAVESRLSNKIELEMSPQLTKPPTTQSNNNWERNQLLKNSPVVFIPTKTEDRTNHTSQRAKHLNWANRIEKHASSEATHVTTPSLTEKRDLQTKCQNESKLTVSQNRPVPPPRTIYNPPNFMVSSDQHASMSQKDLKPQRANIPGPPVPKKRQSLAYSRSLSSSGDFEQKLQPAQVSLFGDIKKLNNGKLARTQSCEPSSTLQRRQNAELASTQDGKYDEVSDTHVYEVIDHENQENIYEVCDDIRSDKYNQNGRSSKGIENRKTKFSELDKWLTPLRKIKLETSPGLQRRNRPGEMASVHNGLAYSLDELADVFAEKRGHFYDNDDNSSIADDEMSLSNEEDMDDRLRQHSLRRCVSADNLLRSGSILDRSMILAKRRRRRMRERRSTSHIFTDSKDFMNFNALTNLTNFGTDANATKARYNKRKTTSNERLFKHKASHTDSGHDSEIVSPCTSPNARRHLNITVPLSYQRPFENLDDSNAPRQGTLPKKPWEIRLRNTQYQKKSRSRENLLTLAPKI